METFVVDALTVRVFDSIEAMAGDAAAEASTAICLAIETRRTANVMFASGNSQLAFLETLRRDADIDWSRVTAFHMDEYVGVGADRPESFAYYMRERIAALVAVGEFHYLQGDAIDPQAEADRYAALLASHPIDLCCLGIGENGHLAFNDPVPNGAEFDDARMVKIVTLDDACKRQQVGEGHFATIDEVPPNAITVTIPGLLAARHVLAIVPEQRKAVPVRDALRGPIAATCPASVLRRHARVVLLLDRASASLL